MSKKRLIKKISYLFYSRLIIVLLLFIFLIPFAYSILSCPSGSSYKSTSWTWSSVGCGGCSGKDLNSRSLSIKSGTQVCVKSPAWQTTFPCSGSKQYASFKIGSTSYTGSSIEKCQTVSSSSVTVSKSGTQGCISDTSSISCCPSNQWTGTIKYCEENECRTPFPSSQTGKWIREGSPTSSSQSWSYSSSTTATGNCNWGCSAGYSKSGTSNCIQDDYCRTPFPSSQTGKWVREGSPTFIAQSWTYSSSTSPSGNCNWGCSSGYTRSGSNCIQDDYCRTPFPSSQTGKWVREGSPTSLNQAWLFSSSTTATGNCNWGCNSGYTRSGSSCIQNNYCASPSPSAQTGKWILIGSPTSVNQAWLFSSSTTATGNCNWGCNSGYTRSGSSCIQNNYCASPSPSAQTGKWILIGSPTSVNQAWLFSSSTTATGNCNWGCNSGYTRSGSSCIQDNYCASPFPSSQVGKWIRVGSPTSINQAWGFSSSTTATGNCNWGCTSGYSQSGSNCVAIPIETCDGINNDFDTEIDEGCHSCQNDDWFEVGSRKYCFDFRESVNVADASAKCMGHNAELASYVDGETETDIIEIINKYNDVSTKQVLYDGYKHLIIQSNCTIFRNIFGSNCGIKNYDSVDADSLYNNDKYACINTNLFCADPGQSATVLGFGSCNYLDCSVESLVHIGTSPANGKFDDGGGGGAVCEKISECELGFPIDSSRSCYTGPPGTEGVGICTVGTETCQADGTWTLCIGEVTPQTESIANGNCGDTLNNDCDSEQDWDFSDFIHGEEDCPIRITSISIGSPP